MRKLFVGIMCFFALAIAPAVSAKIVDFEDLTLPNESYYNGSDGAGGFESGVAAFNNVFDDTYFDYWEGFAYSNTTDTATEGYTNQYSAYPGSGAKGSSAYGVGYQPGYYGFGTVPTIEFEEEVRISSILITNTTYVYLAMKNGYFNATKFGGDSGDTPDWLLLTITGKDDAGDITGTVEFYLADYRFEDNALDYIVDDWQIVDLSGLGKIKRIEFALTSSDTDPDPTIGMNTPSYFAIDNIAYGDSSGSDDPLGCFVGIIGWGLK